MTQTSDDAEREIMVCKNADRYFEYLTVEGQKLRTILVESLPLHAVLNIPLQYKSHIRTLRYVLTLASTITLFDTISFEYPNSLEHVNNTLTEFGEIIRDELTIHAYARC